MNGRNSIINIVIYVDDIIKANFVLCKPNNWLQNPGRKTDQTNELDDDMKILEDPLQTNKVRTNNLPKNQYQNMFLLNMSNSL